MSFSAGQPRTAALIHQARYLASLFTEPDACASGGPYLPDTIDEKPWPLAFLRSLAAGLRKMGAELDEPKQGGRHEAASAIAPDAQPNELDSWPADVRAGGFFIQSRIAGIDTEAYEDQRKRQAGNAEQRHHCELRIFGQLQLARGSQNESSHSYFLTIPSVRRGDGLAMP